MDPAHLKALEIIRELEDENLRLREQLTRTTFELQKLAVDTAEGV